jgi:uncharacterized protein YjbI with pentapeptide repeats
MRGKRWLQSVDRGMVKWVGPIGFGLGLLLAVGIGLPTGVDIYQNWQNIEPGERSQAGITLLQTLFTIVGGVAIFWNIVLSRRQLAATEDRNISDQFSKAVEQLGHENASVRIGAIYLLERIAQDSSRDYWPVMEVLSAFVRENRLLRTDFPKAAVKAEEPIQYDRDIQAAIIVMGRRDTSKDPSNKSIYLNYCDLRGLAFFDDDFGRVRFHRSDLSDNNFSHTNLIGAIFWQASLERANLTKANLSSAVLDEANLQGANLTDCSLNDANLHKANLEGVIGLTVQQIKSAKNWSEANFDPAFRAQLEADSHPLPEPDASQPS